VCKDGFILQQERCIEDPRLELLFNNVKTRIINEIATKAGEVHCKQAASQFTMNSIFKADIPKVIELQKL